MARLAYILAASHSGSTLLAMLLGAHPRACTAGELKATHLGDPARYRCSCGKAIRECSFWAEVTKVMDRKGIAFDICAAGTDFGDIDDAYARRLLRPLVRGPVLETVRDAALALSPRWRSHFDRVAGRNVAFVEALLEVTGADLLVDSSKTGLRLKYLLREPGIDVSVIRLIRDGRGVALAYMDPLRYADASDPTRRAGGFGGDRRSEMLTAAAAAHEWRRSNEEAECLVAALGRRKCMEVRYEALCSDPNGTLHDVFEFLGLDPSQAVLDFRSAEQHVIGNGMRLDSTSEIRLDERWKTGLTAEDLRAFDEVAGDLSRKYGYA